MLEILKSLAKYYNIELVPGGKHEYYDHSVPCAATSVCSAMESCKGRLVRYHIRGSRVFLNMEPKFKIGDIIKYDGHYHRVDTIDYYLFDKDGILFSPFDVEKLKDNVWELIKDFPSGSRSCDYVMSLEAPSFDNTILKGLKKEFVNSVNYGFNGGLHHISIDFTIPGFIDYCCDCNDIPFVMNRKIVPFTTDLKKKITMRSADPTQEDIRNFLYKNANKATVYYRKESGFHVITLCYR